MKSFVPFLILLLSCTEPKRHNREKTYSILDPEKSSPISALISANCINGPAVGIAGTKTPEYDSYEWAQKNAPDSILIQLANYSNPYTRTYAFMALCKRKNPVVRALFDKNIEDTITLKTLNGCIYSYYKLNHLWFSKILPLLDSAESVLLSRKINKNHPSLILPFIPD